MRGYIKTLFSKRSLVVFGRLLVLAPLSILTARFRYYRQEDEED